MADLEKIKIKLKNIFKDRGLENIKIHLESGSKAGDGYAGVIIRALISGGKNNVQEEHDVMVKCVPMNLDIRRYMPITGAFNRENLFYTEIVPYYLKIQKEAKIPEEKELVLPKYYSCSDEYGFEFVILNNLKSIGYEMINCPKNVDYEHSTITMKSLGKLHAISIAFKEQYPKQFAKVLPELKRDLLYGSYDEYDSSGVFYYADMAYEKCLANIKIEEHRERLVKALGNDLGKKLQFLYLGGDKKVLIHGDCWFNNMLFKYKNGTPVGHVLLDFQIVRFSSMANDMMTFLAAAGETELRNRIWDLVDDYYGSFREFMKLLNYNPDKYCTKEELIEEVKTQSLYTVAMKIFAVPILNATEPFNIHDVFSKKIPDCFKKVDENYLKCINGVITDFVNIGFI